MKQKRTKFGSICLYTFLVIVSLLFIFPIYYTLINALRDVYSTPAVLLPKGFHWENFKYAVTLIPFFKYLKNSLIILGITVILGVPLNFLFGYALSRLDAPGKGILFMIVLAQMMIPSFALQIPQYILFSNMGFQDTYWIWVAMALGGNSYQIFLYRQYLQSMPKAIEEAAIIDGCSIWQVIIKVIAPLSKPVVAIAFFNSFTIGWGDYMTPYMYLSKENYPLVMALFSVDYSFPSNPSFKLIPVVNAATLLLMIPVFIVFFLCQKQLVEGATFSGVKG